MDNNEAKVILNYKNKFEHTLNIIKEPDYYSVTCLKNGKEIGFINFSIKKQRTWIHKIKTDNDYLHQGVGTALLYMMEYISMQNRVRTVEGKYLPENKFAKLFYEKYDYRIPNQTKGWDNYDETWTLSKYLDYDKIEKDITLKTIKNDVEEVM